MYRADNIQYRGIDNRSRPQRNNDFEEFTYSDLTLQGDYDARQEFAYWKGVRHRHDGCEYFKSTQNKYGYRVEREDELEHRIMTPSYYNFFNEITPERLARDPENAIYNYYKGWDKNLSDGNVEIAMSRSQLRDERKGNYFRVRNQVARFLYNNYTGINGPVYHPELM